MKYYIIALLTISAWGQCNPLVDDDDPSTQTYPQILTDIPFIEDASAMDLQDLLDKAASHTGLEWLNDEELLGQLGVNIQSIHPDIIVDAFSTTVSEKLIK